MTSSVGDSRTTPRSRPRFLAVVGPTASGKTGLSLELGRILPGEVVSMDSRQVYRGMDVGTGKVGLRERARLPHHGLDILDPRERYSAGRFGREARAWIREIESRHRIPFLVGGTGFFLKALTDPMFSEPEMDPERLEELRDFLNRLSPERLREFVAALDPKREPVAAQGGRQRMTRTVEMALLTGRPLSWWHREAPPARAPLPGIIILLELPREVLYQRINRRVRGMVEEGLVEEVQALLDAGYREEDPGLTGAGYREMVGHLKGRTGLEEAVEEIQRAHRRYARRQITWFRHQLPPGTRGVDPRHPHDELAREIRALWNRALEFGLEEAPEGGGAGEHPSTWRKRGRP